MALHCPECGFVNPEGANYCQKCGAYLARPEGEDASTMTYKVGETGEYEPVDIDEEVDKAGAALVDPLRRRPRRARASRSTATG